MNKKDLPSVELLRQRGLARKAKQLERIMGFMHEARDQGEPLEDEYLDRVYSDSELADIEASVDPFENGSSLRSLDD